MSDMTNTTCSRFRVHVPASSANLGTGFDCMGLALPLFFRLTVTVLESGPSQIIPKGPLLSDTPANSNNMVYKTMQTLAHKLGRPLPPLRLEIESDIPLARGLGSSASALIGALVAANKVLGMPLSPAQILHLAALEEGHPDNVAAAFLGGIVVAVMGEHEVLHVRLPVPKELRACLFIPEVTLKTAEARDVLPQQYSRQDTVYALSRAALMAAALATGKLEMLKEAMQDRLHQPYRAPLVIGLNDILQRAQKYGIIGAALSGAGPSVLCLYEEKQDISKLRHFLMTLLQVHEIQGQIRQLTVDERGTWLEEV